MDGTVVGTPSGIFDSGGRLLASGDVRSLILRGDLYAAIYGRGVIRFKGGSPDVVWQDGSATSLMSDQDGLWIGTDGNGLFKYDGHQVVNVLDPDVLKIGDDLEDVSRCRPGPKPVHRRPARRFCLSKRLRGTDRTGRRCKRCLR